MMALTWRQHRAQLLTAAALVAALSGYLLFSGLQMASFMSSIGLRACLSDHGQCNVLSAAFLDRFGGTSNVFSLVALVPLLAGLFWGAPLIARETERGTHRMAWTQSVSRRQWLGVKLATFAVAATAYQPDSRFWTLQGVESGIFIAAALALLALASWWTIRRIS